MYNNVNIISGLITDASDYVLTNDRMAFAPFFAAVEKFMSENDLVLGGKVAIDIIVEKPLSKESFQWDIFCNDTYKVAKILTDIIYAADTPHVDKKYIVLKTDIKDIEQTIYIDNRRCFKIYRMGMYRNVDINNIMREVTVTGYFGNKIRCISEEICLIGVYRTLYNPDEYDKWEEYLSIEEKLYSRIGDNLPQYSIEKHGGAPTIDYSDDIVNAIKDNAIIIGDVAVKYLGLGQSDRLQFITDKPFDDIKAIIQRVLQRKVISIDYNLDMLGDFRLKKQSLYITGDKGQIHICDIFNNTSFELIPYTIHKGIKIGSIWVLLRFRFIDLWSLKRMHYVLNEKKAIAHNIMGTCSNIEILRSSMQSLDLFPMSYAGVYLAEGVAKKKLIKATEKNQKYRLRPYYPSLGDDGSTLS